MDILIKDWYKPKNCSKCPLGTDIGADSYICQITHKKMFLYPISVIQTCPLIPVPEHGDLIDRDGFFEAEKGKSIIVKNGEDWQTIRDIFDSIRNAPTVLERTT